MSANETRDAAYRRLGIKKPKDGDRVVEIGDVNTATGQCVYCKKPKSALSMIYCQYGWQCIEPCGAELEAQNLARIFSKANEASQARTEALRRRGRLE